MNSVTKGVVGALPFGEHHNKLRGVEQGGIYAALNKMRKQDAAQV